MKPRHLQMIAVGGSIGAGLFVGSGSALTRGGPAGVVIAWIIVRVAFVGGDSRSRCADGRHADQCHPSPRRDGYPLPALGRLLRIGVRPAALSCNCTDPASSIRFIDPSWGFAMGWNYVCVPLIR
jgi:amino acid transporter